MTTYATLDNEGHTIRQGAYIHAFATREEAEDFLFDANADSLDDMEAWETPIKMSVEIGQWSDAWIKAHSEPSPGWNIEPFTVDDLAVQRPGSHPGGNEYWITPRPDVLVAVFESV